MLADANPFKWEFQVVSGVGNSEVNRSLSFAGVSAGLSYCLYLSRLLIYSHCQKFKTTLYFTSFTDYCIIEYFPFQ